MLQSWHHNRGSTATAAQPRQHGGADEWERKTPSATFRDGPQPLRLLKTS